DLGSASKKTSSAASPATISSYPRSGRRARSTTTSGTSSTAKSAKSTTGRANPETPEIALTHGSVPVRLDLTVLRIVRDPVVNHDVGIADAADRPVDIVEHRAIPAGKPSEFTGEGPAAILLRREIHRLGIFEFQAFDIVVGADGKAGVQQVRDGS